MKFVHRFPATQTIRLVCSHHLRTLHRQLLSVLQTGPLIATSTCIFSKLSLPLVRRISVFCVLSRQKTTSLAHCVILSSFKESTPTVTYNFSELLSNFGGIDLLKLTIQAWNLPRDVLRIYSSYKKIKVNLITRDSHDLGHDFVLFFLVCPLSCHVVVS